METSPIKEIIYHKIDEISESRILKELSSGDKKAIVSEILHKCIPEIAKLDGDVHENFGAFAESITHYLLTNALIPSQRKITIKNTEVDVIIPDSRTLDTAPENSLILYFVKTSNKQDISERLGKLQNIQPNKENIWVVSKTHLGMPYKTFDVDNISSFASLLDGIDFFLEIKPRPRFKIFKT
ncbi:MAG: hypothetical protein WAO91_07170 [Candidatus Nitrosotenuis sp.]